MRHVSRHRCRLINSYGKPQERSVPENLELELHKQFSASREKYIYFLLAASATAIGYAMAQSKIEPLDWVHIPLGISIFLWGTSFISGIRFIEYSISSTFQNQNYLAFKREVKSSRVSNPSELIVDFKIKLQTTLKKIERKKKLYGKTQSLSLLYGGLAYICWHVTRMWVANA